VKNKGKHSEPLPPRLVPPQWSSMVSAHGQERDESGGTRRTTGHIESSGRECSDRSSDNVTASDDTQIGDGFVPVGTFLSFVCFGGLCLLGSYSMCRIEMPMLSS
jgi:hypothetical protein